MHKNGASTERVDAELRKAIQEDKSPNFASKAAHAFLGTIDTRNELRPSNIFGRRKGDTSAEHEKGAQGESLASAPTAMVKTEEQ